ncbi:MAG: heavy-metal-associated domain-containing protein [Gammaproteobacteria bacterium]|nr:heavy-metal-associated domain-containing protein [Gammaproteobacteria bacterium]
MQAELFQVQNVKCGGCTKAIEEGLATLAGVEKVTAQVESGEVKVEGQALSRETLSNKLTELGYPEA